MTGKIKNGKDVDEGTMRFIASLRNKKIHFCSGTLISARHVITAGVCVVEIYKREISSLYGISVFIGSRDINISQAEYHEDFHPTRIHQSRKFDVGLILVRPLNSFYLVINFLNFTFSTQGLLNQQNFFYVKKYFL